MQALNPLPMYYEAEALPMRQNGCANFAVQSSSFDWKFHTHGLEETSGEYGHPIATFSFLRRRLSHFDVFIREIIFSKDFASFFVRPFPMLLQNATKKYLINAR